MKNQYLWANLWSGGRKMWWYGRTRAMRSSSHQIPRSSRVHIDSRVWDEPSHHSPLTETIITVTNAHRNSIHQTNFYIWTSIGPPGWALNSVKTQKRGVRGCQKQTRNHQQPDVVCFYSTHLSPLLFFVLFFRAIILHICVATEATFHYASICEILCWITVTSGRCAVF